MTESAYTPGKTIEQVARDQYTRLLTAARSGALDTETAAGAEDRPSVTFTLSGGGPGSDITFIFDAPWEEGGEVAEGFYSYFEGGGTHVIPFGRTDGQVIFDDLLSDPADD